MDLLLAWYNVHHFMQSQSYSANFSDELLTVALRPTMMYGEEDYKFMPTIIKVAHNFNQQIPKLFGQGGKHQITYVGE